MGSKCRKTQGQHSFYILSQCHDWTQDRTAPKIRLAHQNFPRYSRLASPGLEKSVGWPSTRASNHNPYVSLTSPTHNVSQNSPSAVQSAPAAPSGEKFQLRRGERLVAASVRVCLGIPPQRLRSSWILSGKRPRNKQSNPIKLLKLNCTMVMEYLIELLIFRGFRQQPISSKYKVHTLKLTPGEDRAFIWGKWYIIITSRWGGGESGRGGRKKKITNYTACI